ncbi:MAG: PTS sugar transporter subunit IIA [Pseudomonadales bacterium]
MQLHTILTPARTLYGAAGTSRKRTLETAASFIAAQTPAVDADELYRSLIERERLGSTGIGEGVAIPHSRMHNCDAITGTLISLQQAVDFDSIDNKPVDLLFVLLVPIEASDEHLQVLAELARLFSQEEFRSILRDANNDAELYAAAINYASANPSSIKQ